MPRSPFSRSMNLETVNTKLSRVKIRQKGNRLYLRATVPGKDGGGWKQTDIKTGCPGTDQGIKIALGKAQKLESDLLLERFCWDDWTQGDRKIPGQRNIEDVVTEFEKAYWQQREKTESRAGTFRRDYLIHYRLLPLDEPLTVKALEGVLLRTNPDSRTRKACYGAFTRLANHAGLELPPHWVKLRGKYQPKNDRIIPTDRQIIETWEGLSGPWRWVYGAMASYGIRNHEIMHLDFDDFPAVRVGRDTKTGQRICYPLYPDWAERFEVANVQLPNITTADNRQVGNAVGKAFRRLGVEHQPYALRDAYAIRASTLGISPAIASKWMGHSLSVHYGHYLRFIEKSDFDTVWEGLK